MNNHSHLSSTNLFMLILCCIAFLFLVPMLISSINQQMELMQKAQSLSADINNAQNQQIQASDNQTGGVKTYKRSTDGADIRTIYDNTMRATIINSIITAFEAFFTWLSVAIAARIFNDHFYLKLSAFVQRILTAIN